MAEAKQSTGTRINVAEILAHPLRARFITVLAERTASPNELKDELGVSIGDAAYHVKRLHELGAIELIRTQQVRGAVEHFYQAIVEPYLSDSETEELTDDQRHDLAAQICLLIFADATTALESGTMAKRVDLHLGRTPMYVDELGWEELAELYNETLERTTQVKIESAKRMAKDPDSTPIPVSTATMVFEMPEEPKQKK